MMNHETPERPRVAATLPAPQQINDQMLQYLTFALKRETFAIGILAIKEIIEYTGLTTVPMMPACVRGVINLRGAAVPVMDLSVRLGRQPSEVTKRTCIVIIESNANGERQDLGVMVDAVNAVLDIPPADVEPAPTFGTTIRADFIQGLGKVDGRFIILLDINNLLALEEAELLSQAVPLQPN